MKEMVGGCCVCSDERGWDENPLVYCDGHGCNVAVHQACYGIVQVPKGPWFCSKCISQERIARVKCELCPSKEGALKRTDTGGWAHVVCALYIPEVRFGNVATMEPIILASVPHDRYQKTCYICEERGRESKVAHGACMACNKPGCRHAFHVTCAQSSGLLCEESDGTGRPTVKYVGYCQYHWKKKDIKPLVANKTPEKPKSKGPLVEKPKGKQEKDRKAVAKPKSSPAASSASCQSSKIDSTSNKSSAGTASKDTSSKDSSSKELPTPKQRGRKPSSAKSSADAPSTPKTQESPKLPGSNASMSLPLPVVTPTVTTAASTGSGTTVMDEGLMRGAVAAATDAPPPIPPLLNSPYRGMLAPQSLLNSSPLNCALPSSNLGSAGQCLLSAVASPSQFSPLSNSVTDTVVKQQNEKQPQKEKQAEKEKAHAKEKAPAKERLLSREKPTPKEKKQSKEKPQQKDKVQPRLKVQPKEKRPASATTKKRPSKPSDDEPKRKVGRPPKTNMPKSHSTSPVGSPISATAFPHTSSPFNSSLSPMQATNTFPSFSPQNFSAAMTVPTNMPNGMRSPPPGEYVIPQPRHVGSMDNRCQLTPHKPQNNTPLQLPTSLEQLLEYQWEQGAQFLMQQAAQYDVASLMSSLHQLKADNARLEERLLGLTSRRSQLLAVSARLASPMSCTPTSTTTSNTDVASKADAATKVATSSPSLSSSWPGALSSQSKSGQEKDVPKGAETGNAAQNTTAKAAAGVLMPTQVEKSQLVNKSPAAKIVSEAGTVSKPKGQPKSQAMTTAAPTVTQGSQPTQRQPPKQATPKQHIPIKPAPPNQPTQQQEKGKQQKFQQPLHLQHSQQMLQQQIRAQQQQKQQQQLQQQMQLLQQQQTKQPVNLLTMPPQGSGPAISGAPPQQFLYQLVQQSDTDAQRLQKQLQTQNSTFIQDQQSLNQSIQQQQHGQTAKQVLAPTSLQQQFSQHAISLPYATAFMTIGEPLSQLSNTQRNDTMKNAVSAAGFSSPLQMMSMDSSLTTKMFESSGGTTDKTIRNG